MKPSIDENAIKEDLRRAWLPGMGASEAREAEGLIRDLVADWAREANSDADPPAVLAIQKKDLDDLAASHPDRLDALRIAVLQRQLNRLSAKSYSLGTDLIDKRLSADAGRGQGHALLQEIDVLLPKLASIQDAEAAKRLRRDLNEARMEALYAVEGKAMSIRLNHYLQDAAR
jgi:hypothetical protein